MSLFRQKPEIPRPQFQNILKKTNIKIGVGRQLSRGERNKIEKIDFPRRYGPTISKSEYSKTIRRLKAEKKEAPDYTRQIKLRKEIKFLETLEKKEDPKDNPIS